MRLNRLLFILFFIFNIFFANDRITFEKKFYDKYVSSVFTVFGDAGSGTGFLIDKDKGLIVTNYHVISNSRYIRVKLNKNLKVEGQVVAKSMYDDMAIVQINPKFTLNLNECELAPINYKLYIGEPIYAIGSPLNQTELLTKGIISKILDRAILSGDLNINHGNSGGPLFNSEEYVIGVNTFGDYDDGGKISGIIKIDPIYSLIKDAEKFISTENYILSDYKYPTMPQDQYPLSALQEAAYKTYSSKNYIVKNSKFNINITTPPFAYNRSKALSMDLAEIRAKRSKKAGIDDKELLHDWVFSDLYSWFNYLNEYQPVVKIEIIPKQKLSAGSLIGAMLVGAAAGYSGTPVGPMHYKYKYKSDLYDFKLFNNKVQIEELQRSVSFLPAVYFSSDAQGNSASIKDLAKTGVYIFSIFDFAPVNGEFPKIELELYDVVKSKKPVKIKLKSSMVERIWNDFLPYTKLYE